MMGQSLVSQVFNNAALVCGYVLGAFTMGGPAGAMSTLQAKNYLEHKLNS